jgi:hypothetical protein
MNHVCKMITFRDYFVPCYFLAMNRVFLSYNYFLIIIRCSVSTTSTTSSSCSLFAFVKFLLVSSLLLLLVIVVILILRGNCCSRNRCSEWNIRFIIGRRKRSSERCRSWSTINWIIIILSSLMFIIINVFIIVSV